MLTCSHVTVKSPLVSILGTGLSRSWTTVVPEENSVITSVVNSRTRLSLKGRVDFTCLSFVVSLTS